MALPASTFFTSDDTQDEGTVRQGLDDLLEGVIRLAGSSSEGAPVISSGAITPSYGTIVVDTEAAAATDDLTTINQTNIADKCFLWMRCSDNARNVVVKHTTSGTGHIELANSLDFTLNNVGMWIILQRQGTKWVEVLRAGRETLHTASSEFSSGWSSLITVKYWKDEMGVVRLVGSATKASVTGSTATILTLPAGYRPAATIPAQPVLAVTSGTTTVITYVYVTSGGALTWATTTAVGALAAVQLDVAFNVSFRAEA